MGVNYTLCLLLCAAALAVSGVWGKDENLEVYVWTRQRLPVLQDAHTEPLRPPLFNGHEENEERGGMKALCGIECQSSQQPIDQREQERLLGYETMYENGTRTHTDVTLQGFNRTTAAHPTAHTRRKRQVFGADGRFVISDSHFITNYPFSTAVRLSTGCSGVLISRKHVLTAAHCIHDGKDYLEGARGLRVGVLQLKSKSRKGKGRRRGGRRRGERRGEVDRGEEEKVVEAEEQNSIDGEVARERKGGKSRRRRGRKEGDEGRVDHGGESGGRGRKQRGQRIRRSAEPKEQPVFRWARVKQTRIPQGWIQTKSPAGSVSSDYDYAVLELKRPVKQKHMELGVAPSTTPLARIHFSGYDADKSLRDGPGKEKVVYRFCSVENESEDLLYQRCDAQPGATGAGVYIRLREGAGDAGKKGKWQRRVIGVFSGHQWVETQGGGMRDFNVAVRITPPKYAQICYWIHGDPGLCKEV